MLKRGDKVYIDGTQEVGVVKEVHPHEIEVRVGGEVRKYAQEDLRLEPMLGEVSKYVDH